MFGKLDVSLLWCDHTQWTWAIPVGHKMSVQEGDISWCLIFCCWFIHGIEPHGVLLLQATPNSAWKGSWTMLKDIHGTTLKLYDYKTANLEDTTTREHLLHPNLAMELEVSLSACSPPLRTAYYDTWDLLVFWPHLGVNNQQHDYSKFTDIHQYGTSSSGSKI